MDGSVADGRMAGGFADLGTVDLGTVTDGSVTDCSVTDCSVTDCSVTDCSVDLEAPTRGWPIASAETVATTTAQSRATTVRWMSCQVAFALVSALAAPNAATTT